MSGFAALVRQRVALVRGGAPVLDPRAHLQAGLIAVGVLQGTNAACGADPRCAEVRAALEVAARGTHADARTALTRLQTLLRSLTEEDADVADSDDVQQIRRRLHVLLDH